MELILNEMKRLMKWSWCGSGKTAPLNQTNCWVIGRRPLCAIEFHSINYHWFHFINLTFTLSFEKRRAELIELLLFLINNWKDWLNVVEWMGLTGVKTYNPLLRNLKKWNFFNEGGSQQINSFNQFNQSN